MKKYIVKQSIDTLDTKPTVSEPLEHWEAEELASQWIEEAVSWAVQHSPYSISENELDEIRENETALVRIEEI